MKKILALVCSLVMIVSMFAINVSAAVDGAEVTVDFVEYGEEEGYTLIYYDVTVNVPDELSAYGKVKDGLNKYTYSGKGIQGISVELPVPDGLAFLGDDYSEKTFDGIGFSEKNGKVMCVYVNTSTDYSTYKYTLGKIARLGFMVDTDNGYDPTAEYTLTADVAKIGLTAWSGVKVASPTVTNSEYATADFTITAGTAKPAEPEKEPTVNTIPATKDIEIAGTKYLGTAVYEASFDLENVVDTEKDYGITVDGENFLINMNGEGTVNYVLAYYGVTTAPVVTTFWTAQ